MRVAENSSNQSGNMIVFKLPIYLRMNFFVVNNNQCRSYGVCGGCNTPKVCEELEKLEEKSSKSGKNW